jgi:hypothetical protein
MLSIKESTSTPITALTILLTEKLVTQASLEESELCCHFTTAAGGIHIALYAAVVKW